MPVQLRRKKVDQNKYKDKPPVSKENCFCEGGQDRGYFRAGGIQLAEYDRLCAEL